MPQRSGHHRIIEAATLTASVLGVAGWLLAAWAEVVRPMIGASPFEASMPGLSHHALFAPGVMEAAEPFFVVAAATLVAGIVAWWWTTYLPRSGQVLLWIVGTLGGVAVGFHIAQPAGAAAFLVLLAVTFGACGLGWIAAVGLEAAVDAVRGWRGRQA